MVVCKGNLERHIVIARPHVTAKICRSSFHCSITESHPRILIMWVYCCEVSCIGKRAGSIFVDVKVRLTVFKCGVEESLSKLR
jgi:hypothetical protein